MTRIISFPNSLQQYLDGTKTVERRVLHQHLRMNDVLRVVEKAIVGKGKKMKTLGYIRVTRAWQEPLDSIVKYPAYGWNEMLKEGVTCSPEAFVTWFIDKHQGCFPDREITRFEFERIGQTNAIRCPTRKT